MKLEAYHGKEMLGIKYYAMNNLTVVNYQKMLIKIIHHCKAEHLLVQKYIYLKEGDFQIMNPSSIIQEYERVNLIFKSDDECIYLNN